MTWKLFYVLASLALVTIVVGGATLWHYHHRRAQGAAGARGVRPIIRPSWGEIIGFLVAGLAGLAFVHFLGFKAKWWGAIAEDHFVWAVSFYATLLMASFWHYARNGLLRVWIWSASLAGLNWFLPEWLGGYLNFPSVWMTLWPAELVFTTWLYLLWHTGRTGKVLWGVIAACFLLWVMNPYWGHVSSGFSTTTSWLGKAISFGGGLYKEARDELQKPNLYARAVGANTAQVARAQGETGHTAETPKHRPIEPAPARPSKNSTTTYTVSYTVEIEAPANRETSIWPEIVGCALPAKGEKVDVYYYPTSNSLPRFTTIDGNTSVEQVIRLGAHKRFYAPLEGKVKMNVYSGPGCGNA